VVAAEGTEETEGTEFATRSDDGAWLVRNGATEIVVGGGKESQVVGGRSVGPLELEGGRKERRDSPGEGFVQVVKEDRGRDAGGWEWGE
jgi:hypothetical protein